MSDSSAGDPSERAAEEGAGILAALPHTRPQRASARRAAARAIGPGGASGATGSPSPRKTAKPPRKIAKHPRKATKPPRKIAKHPRKAAKPPREATKHPLEAAKPAPRSAGRPSAQRASAKAPGSSPRQAAKPRMASARAESGPAPRQGYEVESDALAGPVQPPGSAELMASASELAGELAKAGATAGARLIKDLLSRLPG